MPLTYRGPLGERLRGLVGVAGVDIDEVDGVAVDVEPDPGASRQFVLPAFVGAAITVDVGVVASRSDQPRCACLLAKRISYSVFFRGRGTAAEGTSGGPGVDDLLWFLEPVQVAVVGVARSQGLGGGVPGGDGQE